MRVSISWLVFRLVVGHTKNGIDFKKHKPFFICCTFNPVISCFMVFLWRIQASKAQQRKDKITDKSYNFISRQNKIFIEQIVGLVGFVLQKYCKGWLEWRSIFGMRNTFHSFIFEKIYANFIQVYLHYNKIWFTCYLWLTFIWHEK